MSAHEYSSTLVTINPRSIYDFETMSVFVSPVSSQVFSINLIAMESYMLSLFCSIKTIGIKCHIFAFPMKNHLNAEYHLSTTA